MSRFRVTVRGDDMELRGFATYEEAYAIGEAVKPHGAIVLASIVDDDYNPFIPPPESEKKGKVGP